MGWLRDAFGRRAKEGSFAAASAPTADEWKKRGNEALAAGRNDEAARCYSEGVSADPGNAALRLNLGFALLELGDAGRAAESFTQALALREPSADFVHEAQFLLGRAEALRGNHKAALAGFEAAVAIKPDFAEAWEEGARVLHLMQRHGEAAQWAGKLASLNPSTFAQLLVASELSLAGELEQACGIAQQVCNMEPANAQAAVLLFGALVKLGRREEALAEAERAMKVVGRTAGALVNTGVALFKLGRLDEALAHFDEALALAPGKQDAIVNRLAVLIEKLRLREAAQEARAALTIYPEDANLHWHLCIALMLLGEFEEGWRESEWRTRSDAFRGKVRQFEQPRWSGEDLAGKAIFLQGEQGFGDNIQFVRFVREVASRAAKVWLQVPEALEPLMHELAPNCEQLRQGARLPAIDFYCPLLSLPAVLGTTELSMAKGVPYLHANTSRSQAWRGRLDSGRLNVGITWCGNPRHVNDHNRSIPLEIFRRAQTTNCRFVTLQPDLREQDRAALAASGLALDLGAQLEGFEDTAALIEALDLVISVDTSVAHLAGAIGKPVWILLPYAPDWRWMVDREDTPWYPSARLFRQDASRRWEPVIERVHAELEALRRPASA
ncbi:MAG TPA: tetratricopeptide repeat protein [Ramlibacter sp.]|nr:tetratricopeptide repeat protein [Ramlibacter sp.]